MKLLSSALNFLEDVRGGGSPDKGLGFCVVCDNMSFDSFNQFIDATEDTPSQAVDRKIPEESFDHVEPGCAGRSEVKVESRIASLPGFHSRMLMGGVIIADDVYLLVGGCRFDNQVEEADPFLVPVFFHTGSKDAAVGSIHCSEERGGSVAFVIVSQRFATSFLQWESWLSAIQGLDLALFIAGQHDSVFRRVEIEANDVLELLLEMLVVGELEGSYPVRFDPVRSPYAAYARRANSNFAGHGCPTPMGSSLGLFFQRQTDDSRFGRSRKRWDAAWPGFVFENALNSSLGIAMSPTPYFHLVLAELQGDLLVLQAISSQQNDSSTLPSADGTGPACFYGFQFLSLLETEFNLRCNFHPRTLALAA